MSETWTSAYDNPDFMVSSYGRVVEVKTGRVIKPTTAPTGYVYISFGGKGYRLNRLVAISFKGFPEKGFVCCHEDGNKQNNRLENLVYKTQKENIHDKYKHGTMFRGKKAPAAKYGKELTDKILALSEHKTCRQISEEIGLCFSTIARVIRYHKGRRRVKCLQTPHTYRSCPLNYLKTLVNQAQTF